MSIVVRQRNKQVSHKRVQVLGLHSCELHLVELTLGRNREFQVLRQHLETRSIYLRELYAMTKEVLQRDQLATKFHLILKPFAELVRLRSSLLIVRVRRLL